MTISAKTLRYSRAPSGILLPTMELLYPRFIHAEFMTHRVLSRNASSSRAIPVERLIKAILEDPAMPIHWGKNQPGMQAHEELGGLERAQARRIWLEAMHEAVRFARAMHDLGAHKQIVNRLLEPFAHIRVVMTGDLTNFFGLRRHPDAQPEIRALADAMWEALQDAEPQDLALGEWHLPYVLDEEIDAHGGLSDPTGILRKVSAARCARTSYKTHDGRVSEIDEDVGLYERLVGGVPLHASPTEHQATPDYVWNHASDGTPVWARPDLHGNLFGWRQNRKYLPNENITSLETI